MFRFARFAAVLAALTLSAPATAQNYDNVQVYDGAEL